MISTLLPRSFQPQNYQSSSTMPEDDDASKDLDLALDESFRSILGSGNKENREVNSGTVFKVC